MEERLPHGERRLDMVASPEETLETLGRDAAIAGELELHLRRFEGAPDAPPQLSAEARDLSDVLEQLHNLACFLDEPDIQNALVETCDADISATVKNPPQAAPSTPDRIGKYEVRRRLGAGGQAATFLAFDPDLKRHAVLKLYHEAKAPAEQEQVLREGQALARVRSPYVAQCYHADRLDGIPYLVVEYIAGENLADRHRRKPIGTQESIELVAQLADGLSAVHACGLLHRDIKPANVLIGDDGKPRLVDFGLAAHFGSDQLKQVSGTLPYMAPEAARGESDRIDIRSDIFGLGAVLYYLLTGSPPHPGKDKAELYQMACRGEIVPVVERNPQIARDVNEACMRAIAKDPYQRFASATEFRDALKKNQPRRKGFVLSLQLGRFQLGLSIAALAIVVCAVVLLPQWRSRLGPGTQFASYSPEITPSSKSSAFKKGRSGDAASQKATAKGAGGSKADVKSAPDHEPAIPLVEPMIEPGITTDSHTDSKEYAQFLKPAQPSKGAPSPKSAMPATVVADVHPAVSPPGDSRPFLTERPERRALARQFRLRAEMTGGRVAPNGQVQLEPGDKVGLTVETERDCYLCVWIVDPSGTILQLFPNNFQSDNAVRAGTKCQIPDDDEYSIKATPSKGPEWVHVFASTARWEPIAGTQRGGTWAGYEIFTAPADRGRLEARVRGLVLEANADKDSLKPVPGRPLVSEAIIPFRVSAAK